MGLLLVRLPSGRWALLAVPDPQHVATKRGAATVVRENFAEVPPLTRLRPAAAEAAA